MRFVSTKTHAVNDYIFGAMLIVVPLMYRDTGGAAVWLPVALGAVMLVQSLMTDYEISLANLISVKAHLAMDAASGLLLAASPWLFGFADVVWVPHFVVGIIELLFAATTQLHRTERAYAHRAHDTGAHA